MDDGTGTTDLQAQVDLLTTKNTELNKEILGQVDHIEELSQTIHQMLEKQAASDQLVVTLTTDKQVLQSRVDDTENELDSAQAYSAKLELDISGHKGVISQQVDLIHSLQDQLKVKENTPANLALPGLPPDFVGRKVLHVGTVKEVHDMFRQHFLGEGELVLVVQV